MNNKAVLSQHLSERQALMTRLLDAVKQCQIRFGGRSELATENDSRVSCLCAAWEAVLQHGLKHTNKALSTLKQVTEMTGLSKISSGLGLLDEIKNMETEPSFWHYIKEHVNKQDMARFTILQSINTEEGRGRAWLRSALNEHSMEKYMHMVIEDQLLLGHYYEEWSFLRDQERSCMLPNMAGGLGSILFAINIDNPDLNSIKPATGLDNLVSLSTSLPAPKQTYAPTWEAEPQPVIGGEGSPKERRKERKKKKKVAKIVSFEDDLSSYSGSPASSVASPLSKSSSFDLGYQPVTHVPGRRVVTGFDPSKSEPKLTSIPSETFANNNTGTTSIVDNREVELETKAQPEFSVGPVEEKTDMDLELDQVNAGEQPKDYETAKVNQTGQRFPSANDVLHLEGIKRWQDVLGIDQNASDNFSEDSIDQVKIEATKVEVQVENDHDLLNERRASVGSAQPQASVQSETSQTGIQDKPGVNSSDTISGPISQDISQGEIKEDQLTVDQNDSIISRETNQNISGVKDKAFDSSSGNTDQSSTSVQDKEIINESSICASEPSNSKEASNNIETSSVFDSKTIPSAEDTPLASATSTTTNTPVSSSILGNTAPPASRRQLPSGSSLDNADTKSNTSFGSYSSAGENSFYGTMSSDPNLLPMNSDGVLQLTDTADTRSNTESVDSCEVGMYNEATESAMQAVVLAQKGLMSSLRTQGDGSHTPEPIIHSHDTMTTGELKQAVIAMMVRKDEVEQQNKSLHCMLEEERERSSALRLEMDELRQQHRRRQDTDNDKLREMTRENDLLKHQLRKYVGAVQMLRRQGASDEDFSGLHLDKSVQPAIPYKSPSVDYSHEVSEYEKKLVQLAEMHGELIELNEHLQHMVKSKDFLLTRMKQELESIRGPLPQEPPSGLDTMSIQSADSDFNARSLVNIWIPSAFLRGRKSDTFHVYQVYVRIRDEEWNVYRRYSEFRDMHQLLKKRIQRISAIDFPPKKSIGHKDPRFVEQRRKKLQVYLRKVLNLLNQTQPDMGTASKQTLIAMLPFFSDVPVADKNAGNKRERSRSRGRNEVTTSRRAPLSPNAPAARVYDGL